MIGPRFWEDARVLQFTKYQGLGNDFIVLDRVEGGGELTPAQVRALCERHRGVGADGVLTVWPDTEADARMQVQNADGSDSEMCGNGLRCVACFLHDSGRVAPSTSVVRLRAGRRVYTVERTSAERYRVAMGTPTADSADLPAEARGRRPISVASGGRTFHGLALAFGNPHLVIFTDEDPMLLAQRHGAELERHPGFPRRVNVGFARRHGDDIAAVVYERGVGITQACGSGACAVATAAVWLGLAPAASSVRVLLPGGPLVVTVDTAGEVTMEGEAMRVFSGEVARS